jgi:hypothetical protein
VNYEIKTPLERGKRKGIVIKILHARKKRLGSSG